MSLSFLNTSRPVGLEYEELFANGGDPWAPGGAMYESEVDPAYAQPAQPQYGGTYESPAQPDPLYGGYVQPDPQQQAQDDAILGMMHEEVQPDYIYGLRPSDMAGAFEANAEQAPAPIDWSQRFGDMGVAGFGPADFGEQVRDFATTPIDPLVDVSNAVKDSFGQGGVGFSGGMYTAPEVNEAVGGVLTDLLLPTTPLDLALTAAPFGVGYGDDIMRGGRALRNAAMPDPAGITGRGLSAGVPPPDDLMRQLDEFADAPTSPGTEQTFVKYRYTSPGPAGPYEGSLAMQGTFRRGDIVKAPFGDAEVLSASRMGGAIDARRLPDLQREALEMGIEPIPNGKPLSRAVLIRKIDQARAASPAPGSVTPPVSSVGDAPSVPQTGAANIGATQQVGVPARGAADPSSVPPSPAAPPSIPPGAPPVAVADAPAEGFAANIRLSKYAPDLRDTVKGWADANPDVVQAARRGTIPDAQVAEDARSLVEDMGGDFDKLQKGWKPGQAFNAEEVVAIKGLHAEKTRAVVDAARAAREVDSTENQLRFAEAILEQQRVQSIVHGVTAEAGRALRAFRQQADTALGAGDVKSAQEFLRRAIGTSDPDDIATLADALKALDEVSPVAANKLIRDVNKPGFWDKLHWYWMNSILSGPITQTRNIIGNAGSSMYTPVQRLAASGIEQPLAAIQGRQAQRFWQEAPAFVAGMVQGFPEGVRGALTTLRTGISPQAAAKLDTFRPAPIGGLAGRVLGAPTTALGAADEFFSAINYRASLNADAVRMARSEGLKGNALTNRIAELVNDPPPNLMKQATDEAENLVFRGDTGKVARDLARLRHDIPGGRYIVPFLNTPANLLKYGVKNSPLGLLDVGQWKKAIAGNPEGVDELTRGFMGASVAAALGSLVATGAIDITAAAPVNAAERDRFFREGKMPFSVKIPGIGWVEYKQIPAMDTTFTLVASVVDGVRRGEDVTGIASQAAANIATSMLDKSYMNGIGDLFDAVQDPMRYAERYVTRQLSGYVPFSGMGRQTAQAMDQTVRDPEGFVETIKTQTPFLSKDVPSRLTAFGEDASRGLPSPMKVSEPSQSDVDKVLSELGVEVGFVGNTIGGVKLTREDKHLYQQVAGKLAYMDLADLIASKAWELADASEKQELIEKTVNSGRAEVRKAFTALLEKEGTSP
jgi:hypothetical protein